MRGEIPPDKFGEVTNKISGFVDFMRKKAIKTFGEKCGCRLKNEYLRRE